MSAGGSDADGRVTSRVGRGGTDDDLSRDSSQVWKAYARPAGQPVPPDGESPHPELCPESSFRMSAVGASIDVARAVSDEALGRIRHGTLRRTLKQAADAAREAAQRTAATELLHFDADRAGLVQPESELEKRTAHLTQRDIVQCASGYARRGRFILDLESYDAARASNAARKLAQSSSSVRSLQQLAPSYRARYSASSRVLLLGGRHNGHVVVLDWRAKRLMAPELHLGETVRDVTMLHSDGLFATAQHRYVYIYDAATGAQIHCLREHAYPQSLAFLRHHLLLLSINEAGVLRYTDVSRGTQAAECSTHLGRPTAYLAVSPYNGVALTGHRNGVVQLWSPAAPAEPLAQILAHPSAGGVAAVAADASGRWVVTAGVSDGRVKVWDARRLFAPLHTHRPVGGGSITSLDTSQTGMLAAGFSAAGRVTVWRQAGVPDEHHPDAPHRRSEPSSSIIEPVWQTRVGHGRSGVAVCSVAFCPYEDVLGIGHSGGFESCLVPGAGASQFDAREPNPFMGKRQRREAEVRALLEKLPPESIALDPNFIGTVERDPRQRQREARRRSHVRAQGEEDCRGAVEEETTGGGDDQDGAAPRSRRQTRGRNPIGNRLRRRQKNVIDDKLIALRRRRERQLTQREHARHRGAGAADDASDGDVPEGMPRALAAFYRHRSSADR
ncbi:hypothetical protein CDCA_CDCA06G1987 [Cyanidium caldarium]|uniref:BING4 C-terminal domain-containing protein n=1 Tax=Cyanidium caldarium TaxID=2771 RepID=A0AAV9IUG5_CYACA|nr:hypothetical protein CDCA_CDCA06G1987 [Cyanidium caldarium]